DWSRDRRTESSGRRREGRLPRTPISASDRARSRAGLREPSHRSRLSACSCPPVRAFCNRGVLDIELLLVEQRIPAADMGIAHGDGGEWRLVAALRRYPVPFGESAGDERIHVPARVLVPGKGEGDTLVTLHLADRPAHARHPALIFFR